VYGHLVGTIAQKAVDGAVSLIAHIVHIMKADAGYGFVLSGKGYPTRE
jgi:hypothetical protein